MSPDEADALAARLLGDVRTKLGELHLTHARRVAAGIAGPTDDRIVAAALLHDVLEKTETTVDELRAMTDDAGVVDLVVVLTQDPAESDREYLARCAGEPTALRLKRIDLADKFAADDSRVSATIAEQIRHEARDRLELLERLAADG